jgi:hypothetical protein
MNYRTAASNSNPEHNHNPNIHNSNDNSQPHKKTFYCAGILPYQVNEHGEVYMLLGQDENGCWSDFGGKSELTDNNDAKQTASREFYEETLNSVIDKQTIDMMLQDEKKFKFLQAHTVRGLPYFMFVLRIPMLNEARDRFLSTRKFLSIARKYNSMYHLFDTKDSDWKFFEKKDIKWISLDTILMCLDDTNNTGWKLRDIFKTTLKSNINELIKLNLEKGRK